ncbi:MAG: ATP synthase F0 subunit B [Acidimicrobiales bacterium]
MSHYDDPAYDDHEMDIDLTPPSVGAQYHPAETEDVLLTLRDMIESARDVPLSASSMISKDEVVGLIDEALVSLPEELRAARWLLKEREEFLARTRHEADDIVEQARSRAERMVQRTEVVKAAEQRAYDIVDAAQADARRLRHEVEDFCDQKLASFEIVLERTQRLVGAGRAKLQGTNLLAEAAAAAAAEQGIGNSLHDNGDYSTPGDDFSALPSSSSVYDELSQLDDAPALYDEEGMMTTESEPWDEGALPFNEDHGDRPRLTVVDDRFSDLPPPPSSNHPTQTIRGAASNFFDQDFA